MELLQKAIHARSLVSQAEQQLKSAQHDQAIEAYNVILSVSSGCAAFRMNRADAYIAKGDHENAVGDLV